MARDRKRLRVLLTLARKDFRDVRRRLQSGIAKKLRVDSPPDVLEFSHVGRVRNKHSFPLVFTSTLWNASAETLAANRNPLFGIDLRALSTFSLTNSTRCILGSSRFVCTRVLWDLIICDVWRASQGIGVQETDANGGLRLEYELSQWYKKEKAARTRPISEMPNFSIKNLGSRDNRELKTKVAGSSTLLFFAIFMIEEAQSAYV